MGLDIICWECDYPHSDTTWPRAPEILWESVAGLPEQDVHKLTWKNACELFQFDPFAHRAKEDCTVAALRAASPDVDLSLHSAGGTSPVAPGQIVTAADITKQLAALYTQPEG